MASFRNQEVLPPLKSDPLKTNLIWACPHLSLYVPIFIFSKVTVALIKSPVYEYHDSDPSLPLTQEVKICRLRGAWLSLTLWDMWDKLIWNQKGIPD